MKLGKFDYTITIGQFNEEEANVTSLDFGMSIGNGEARVIDLNKDGVGDFEIGLESLTLYEATLKIKKLEGVTEIKKEDSLQSISNVDRNNNIFAILFIIAIIAAVIWWYRTNKK